ncbi:Glycerophosphoryl diester phosphodiesterase [Grimontia indica]|uniref:Glycerophosphoryl diester phosphodiesterase n=1 Tax=Grimontia indica TaxID=1056512 RepID=R1GV61_9GAMM|nr:glycerophosphodiester phosphodiesterase family protein [Grimontia indica]EOD79909.1 Glycerophosphoryl diester phosphodiesterase [Grimontia indica]
MSFNFCIAGTGKIYLNSHRGYSTLFPENTLPAFQGALKAGTSTIEIDIAMTADNQIVVIHDPSVERTSNGQGYVELMTYAELAALDFGGWFSPEFEGTKILLLTEALLWAMENNVGLVVEAKQRRRRDAFVLELSTLLKRIPKALDHIQLLAFDHVLINQVKKRVPEVNLQVVTLARYNNQLSAVLNSRADCVCFEYPNAHVEDLVAYKEAGLCTRLYLPTKENNEDTTLFFNRQFGYDVRGEIIGWMRDGLIDMISHDDIAMLRSLADEAGLEGI